MVSRNILSGLYFVRRLSSCVRKPVEAFKMNNDTVLTSELDFKRVIQINRHNVLNAFNDAMVRRLNELLKAFHEDPNVGLVIIKGNHKAFCAGGDVVGLTSDFASGKIDHNKIFIQLMHTVHSFSKPYVAIIDGITMGGGCGLALNGEKFVIATERTMVAMPETYIGYYPDSGAAHFFKGNLGMFLGLTGFRLKGADVFHTGLATHFVSSNDLPILERHLLNLSSNEASKEKIQEILSNFHSKNLPPHTLQPHLEEIEKHFSKNSVEDIMDSLKNSNSEFSKKIFSDLQKLSPTALKVTFQHIRNGPQLTFHELLTIENRLSQRFLRNHDFHEGTRALLIDKDKNPKWKPSTLEEVSQEMVDSYFQPLEIPENEWFLENRQSELSENLPRTFSKF